MIIVEIQFRQVVRQYQGTRYVQAQKLIPGNMLTVKKILMNGSIPIP
jgi:hypothetical protein